MSNKVIQWLNGELSKEEASQWQKGFILRLLSSLKRLFIMAGFGALPSFVSDNTGSDSETSGFFVSSSRRA
jgi:hypothetical protein